MNNGYTFELLDRAKAALRRLDKTTANRIVEKFRWLAANAETVQHVALKGQWIGYYRLRIGDYRAIYRLEHDNRLIVVALIGHRREVYD